MVDGARIRKLRIRLQLTISALSKRSGVNRDLISAIERGLRPCSPVPLEKLVATLNELLAYRGDAAVHADADDE